MRTIWPFRHIGLKVLAVAFAVVLWLVVSGEEIVERTLRAPLELQQYPAGIELIGEAPSTVDVRVRGASGTLARLGSSDVIAELDLRSAKVGRRLFRLTPDEVRAPFGVEVVQINPATVAIAFEPSRSRQVPIVPSVDGKPAPGFVLGRVDIRPAQIEVVGPESAVQRITDAFTEPVSVAGARDSVTETVTVGVLDSALRLKGPRTAAVRVEVAPAPLERTFHDIPVHLRHLPVHLTATAMPSAATVSLRGSRETFRKIDADGVDLFVDVSGLGPGTYSLPLHADAGDAGVDHVEPTAVQVRIASGKD